MKDSERRNANRAQIIAPCELTFEGIEERHEGQVFNLGQHGAFIKSETEFPENLVGLNADIIIYDYTIPGMVKIRSSGKIVHEDNGGIGFYLRSMDLQSSENLKSMLSD